MKVKISIHSLLLIGSSAVLIMNLLACSTPTGQISIESDPPGADVFVVGENQVARKIGVSPASLDEASLGIAKSTYRISISKDGYQQDSVLMSPSMFSRNTRITSKLKPLSLPASCINSEAAMSKVAQGVAEVQGLMRAKDFENAEKKLIVYTTDYSNVSVFFDLLGNVHYLRKNLDQALIAYRKSYAINNQNIDTQRMIKKIEQIRGSPP